MVPIKKDGFNKEGINSIKGENLEGHDGLLQCLRPFLLLKVLISFGLVNQSSVNLLLGSLWEGNRVKTSNVKERDEGEASLTCDTNNDIVKEIINRKSHEKKDGPEVENARLQDIE